MQDIVARIRNALNRLSRRERYAVYLAVAVISAFVFFRGVVAPIFSYKRGLEAQLAGKMRDLSRMEALKEEYESLSRAISTADNYMKKRPADFTLFSFLDTLAGKVGVKSNIAYMRPSATDRGDRGPSVSAVEMKLDGVSLENLVSYLYMIESSGAGVFVTRLSIASRAPRGKDQPAIEAVMRVEAPMQRPPEEGKRV